MHTLDADEEQSQAVSAARLSLGRAWEAVGPFPSGMREHPFIASPTHAFPCETYPDDPDVDFARRPYRPNDTWPSELGRGGRIGWRRFRSDEDGWLEVSYPDIRWDQLRSDHGWSTLQYQVLLRATIIIPSMPHHDLTPLSIDLIQGTEYAFVPIHREPEIPTIWYNGDLYNYASSSAGTRSQTGKTSNLARSVSLRPGSYTMLVRAMYEIRMFGDPSSSSVPARGPVIRLKVQVEVDKEEARVVEGLAIVPDVVDGWTMGDWMSLGIRAGREDVVIIGAHGGLEEEIQVDMPALRIRQSARISPENHYSTVTFTLKTNGQRHSLDWVVHLRQHRSESGMSAFKATFASPSTHTHGSPASVSYATIIPPSLLPNISAKSMLPPVILALHGAGVDADSPAWADVIPKREGGWAVLPTGRTEWGEDWHGGSMADAWTARDVLPVLTRKLGYEVSTDTLLIGHSNGGQGAWHLAARYPDRVVGVIAASGWLTIHDYVPYTEQVSSHFADPALMGILRSSLAPYDNDLHASNLVGIPILAVHGAEDDNVPPRHSRAHIAAIAAWAGNQDNLTLLEVPKKGHIWSDIFKEPEVIKWIDELVPRDSWEAQRRKGFTSTCANPQESGGRAGVRITELAQPGKLGRLKIGIQSTPTGDKNQLKGVNVARIAFQAGDEETAMTPDGSNNWQFDASLSTASPARAYGPMIRLLATDAVMTVVRGVTPLLDSLASRIAHDVYLNHRIDVEIIDPEEAIKRVADGKFTGSLVCLGRPEENEMVRRLMSRGGIPVAFPRTGMFTINERRVDESGTGIISLHPHPCSHDALAAIIAGNDDLGMDLAARLFPIRTGVSVPDWAVVSPDMRWKGAGGLIGAGFWSATWGYNEAMCWLDR